VLSTPRMINGPTWSRGKVASSSTTGKGGGWLVLIGPLSVVPGPWLSVLLPRATDNGLSSHRMTQINLPINMVTQLADDAAVLFAGDQLQAFVGNPPQLEKLVLQIAHDLAHRGPVDLVAGQAAHLVYDLVHLVRELIAHAPHDRNDIAHHPDSPLFDAHVAGI